VASLNPYYSRAINKANQIYNEFYGFLYTLETDYNPQVILSHLIYVNDIHYVDKSFSTDKFCGMLVVDELGTTILTNSQQSPTKKLFTLAHEFGHFYLHRDKRSQFVDNHNIENNHDDEMKLFETQANLFASEILFPEKVISYMLYSRYSFFKIAQLSGASLEALKWRLIRYLELNYTIQKQFATLIVEQYRTLSKQFKHSNAAIFNLDDPFNYYEIYNELKREKSSFLFFPQNQNIHSIY
jgi:Zn-dependent peptidase ImmA (M78 family)